MLEKPWVVYIKKGVFAETINPKFHSERMAKRRLREILKHNPQMRGKVGIYRKRPMPNGQRLIANNFYQTND